MMAFLSLKSHALKSGSARLPDAGAFVVLEKGITMHVTRWARQLVI